MKKKNFIIYIIAVLLSVYFLNGGGKKESTDKTQTQENQTNQSAPVAFPMI